MQVIMFLFFIAEGWSSVLPEREIQEVFYYLKGILQNIFISVVHLPEPLD